MGQSHAGPAGQQASPVENHRKRNLANQRNYRNRQKQYVDELEHRLRAYEREGAEATESVQRAARRVHEENAALRRLLQAHLGWSPEEVDDRLLHEYHDLRLMSHPGYHPVQAGQTPSGVGKHKPTSSGTTFQADPPRTIRQGYDTKIEPLPSPRWWGNSVQYDRPKVAYPKYEYDDSVAHPPALKDSISCEDAAAILAEFRSQAELDLIKGELGCAPTRDRECNISHRDLFAKLADST